MRRHTAFLLAMDLLFSATPLVAQTSTSNPGHQLIGIWASENAFGPAIRGELTITREGDSWRASIRTLEVPVMHRGDSLSFSVPGNLGSFRGTLRPGGRSIHGWWIQPTGVTFSQAYATPADLQLVGPGNWRGTVVPLDDRFDLYLAIWRRADGVLLGAFRNPQFNTRGRAPQFRVTIGNDSIRFTAPPDTTVPQTRYAGNFDSTGRQITMMWPFLGRVVVLTPLDSAQAIGFLPRVPPGTAWRYRQPAAENDGWLTARASATGMDEAALEGMIQHIADTSMLSYRSPFVHSILIARHGRLVMEEYFMGYDRSMTHDTRSAAKTYASVMVGAAMLAGTPIGTDTRLYPLVGALGQGAPADPRRDRITIAHLMTHSTGLACDDNQDDSPGNEDAMQQQTAQPDWWRYTLDLPMAYEPGTHYAYCSATMSLVGAALTAATHTWLPEYFDRTVARPLQFGRYYYNLQPTLEGYLGGGIQIQPRDLLKIGQVYLDGGTWHGRRLVSADWVRRSTMLQVTDTTHSADGYAWHRAVLNSGGRAYREYEANGNGGQYVIVLPELDIVIVFTAGNYGQYGVWGQFRDNLVTNVIIPAIQDR
ncbi:MAG: serine hydrolase domain-containing protein [Gemmatimonadota bacterium]